MSTCLYCGAELNSRTANFCRGHHRPYRANLIQTWLNAAADSAERAQAGRQLRRFPGWWDYNNNVPALMGNGSSTRTTTRRVSTPAPARPVYAPIEYNFRKFGIELETASPSSSNLEDALNMARAMGIEIQNTDYTHRRTDYWKVLTDGSLSGGYCREIVSPPIASENKISEVFTLTTILNTMGVKTNNTCGFHCHLDVSDLTPKQIARIAKFYQVYEAEIDKLHQTSRRGNRGGYCHSLEGKNINPDAITSVDQLVRVMGTRYLKVNVEAYMRHGTIEFRQHGATIDPVKIINWVKFCTRIVEYAKSDRPIDASVPLFTALNISPAEQIYWKHRKEVLAA